MEMVNAALGRDLGPEEMAAARKNLRAWRSEQRKRSAKDRPALLATSSSPEHEAWSRMYHALYNSAEFRYRN